MTIQKVFDNNEAVARLEEQITVLKKESSDLLAKLAAEGLKTVQHEGKSYNIKTRGTTTFLSAERKDRQG